jgi:hypothetical protein
MRLRVAVDWAGDVVEDRTHDARSLRVGADELCDVTVPGDPTQAIRFVEIGALAVMELPASLVAAIEWPEGVCEAIAHDTELTLAGARSAGRLVLRGAPFADHATAVRFSIEPPLPSRVDVALAAWAAGALSLACLLGAGVAFVESAHPGALASPRNLDEGQAQVLRVSLVVDPQAALEPLDERTGNRPAYARDGIGDASRYARLLVEGFDHYAAGDLASAEESWSDASHLQPQRPEAYVNLAQIAKRRGELDAERRWLRVALSLAPTQCEALVNAALAETRGGNLAGARDALRTAGTACGDRISFVMLDEAALRAAERDVDGALGALETAEAALVIDAPDKRREALTDLVSDPLFAALRGTTRFRTVVEHLRRSLTPPQHV